MYSYKEVEQLLQRALATGGAYGMDMDQANANSWIKNNLKERSIDALPELSVFVPTHFLLDEVDNSGYEYKPFKWIDINKQKSDWFVDKLGSPIDHVQVLGPGLARVIFTTTYMDDSQIERVEQGVYRFDTKLSK